MVDPAQLTVTISITRWSTACAGLKPRPTKPTVEIRRIEIRLITGATLDALRSIFMSIRGPVHSHVAALIDSYLPKIHWVFVVVGLRP